MMKRLFEVIGDTQDRLLHPVDFYRCLGSSLRAFILEGAVSIETTIEDQPLNNNKNYWFRTTIQLDGDIISIVPKSNPEDSDYQEIFQTAYIKHQKKLRHFVSQLDGIRIIAWMTGTIISAIAAICSWKFGPSEIWGYAFGWVYLILWPIIAYFIRKYGLRNILWLAIRFGAWWNKKRLRLA